MDEQVVVAKSYLEELEQLRHDSMVLFDYTPNGVVSINLNGRVTHFNRSARRIYGVPDETAQGVDFFRFCPEELLDAQRKKFRDVFETGEPNLYETEQRSLSGETIDVDFSVSLRKDLKGNKIGWYVIVRDISSKKTTERKIARNEKKMRSIFRAAPIGIGVMSKRCFTEVNEMFCTMLGYSRGELLGQNARLLYDSGADYDYVGHEKYRQVGDKGVGSVETRLKRKDGGVIDVLISSTPLNPNDLSEGVAFTALDITSRIEAEAKLASRASTLDVIFNSTPNVLMLMNRQCRVEKINHQGVLFSGRKEGDIVGMYCGMVLNCHKTPKGSQHLESPECRNCPLGEKVKATFNTGKSYWKEQGSLVTEKNGNKQTLNMLFSTALIDIEGQDRVLVSLTDITALTQKDIALRKEKQERDKLEHQFRQAQKMESIGRLAGGIAHDLNNLLSPILGYGELLVEDLAEEDPRHDSAKEIVNAGVRAGELVRQLLAFSRKQTLDYTQVDINRLYENFVKLLRRTIREDIEIKATLADSLPMVRGDIGQLEQVVMNLCVNSQDAMPEGGLLYFETKVVELDEEYAADRQGVTPGEYVMLSITDTGIGMSEEISRQVFEPFFTTKEKHKGTGLGLATVYGIVKQHGGNIWCYSEEGKGATFKIYLPVSIGDMQDIDQIKEAEVGREGSGETVLVVEDNIQLRAMAITVLSRNGYNVFAAASGSDALELCRQKNGKVDLLLTDVVMPEMNGRELSEKIIDIYPHIRVLFMSGYPEDILSLQNNLGREVPYMQKPFSVNSLLLKVREALTS